MLFDAGVHTLVIEDGLARWAHTISLLLPLVASHCGGSWGGLAALQLCACVVSVRASFALGLGCPGGGGGADRDDALFPPPEVCVTTELTCAETRNRVGDLLDDIYGGSGSGSNGGNMSSSADGYGYNSNASSAMYPLYEPRFSVAAALVELRARWDDWCYGGFTKVWCERCDAVASH